MEIEQKNIDIQRSYETLVILQSARDTVCPEWLFSRLDAMIFDCWERVGDKLILDFSE